MFSNGFSEYAAMQNQLTLFGFIVNKSEKAITLLLFMHADDSMSSGINCSFPEDNRRHIQDIQTGILRQNNRH